MDAKDKAEQLKANQGKLIADLRMEQKMRSTAEDQVTKMLRKCQSQEEAFSKLKHQNALLASENASMQRKLKQLRCGAGTGAKSIGAGCDTDRFAHHMAATECGPLGRCISEEKAALKKKLLLKWHPDKQPSAEHSAFATLVMQEMQNHPAWKD
jgi:hypothetical protein